MALNIYIHTHTQNNIKVIMTYILISGCWWGGPEEDGPSTYSFKEQPLLGLASLTLIFTQKVAKPYPGWCSVHGEQLTRHKSSSCRFQNFFLMGLSTKLNCGKLRPAFKWPDHHRWVYCMPSSGNSWWATDHTKVFSLESWSDQILS